MSASLTQAISDMRTMRESYDVLAQQASVQQDVQGRTRLAAAISAKGVPSTVVDNLSSMAAKIGQIPQQVNTRTSDFEQMLAPTPYMWNVYSIATDLMENTLPNYFPSYMQDYKSRYGTNAFFVGEYYLGYASLELTGADGYLTNDGDFYTIAGEEGSRVVTHTLPNGTVETYSAESIVHQWHDNDTYCNRWVAFFYLSDGYSFTNVNSSICPRRVALCGNCGSFIVSGENRLTDVWVIGSLGHFEGGTSGSAWNPAQVIRNYKTHSGGYIYFDPTNVISIVMPDLETMTDDVWTMSGSYNLPIQSIILPKLTSAPHLHVFYRMPNLAYFYSTETGVADVPQIFIQGHGQRCDNLTIELPNITEVKLNYPDAAVVNAITLKELLMESLETIRSQQNSSATIVYAYNGSINVPLKKVYLPNLKLCTRSMWLSSNGYLADLKDFWVGEMAQSMNLSLWTATNVTTSASEIAEINANIRNHIAARIKDMTGETAPTVTFSANLFNNLEQATIDAFEDKNWIVASA